MKKYIIHSVSRATKDNPNFAGDVHETYHGKGDKLIGSYGSHAERFWAVQEVTNYRLCEYGYDRLCDAKRNWSYRNPENDKYWQTEVEIKEVEL